MHLMAMVMCQTGVMMLVYRAITWMVAGHAQPTAQVRFLMS